jgi:hypothetical protein
VILIAKPSLLFIDQIFPFVRDPMPKNGEVNSRFGVYRTAC